MADDNGATYKTKEEDRAYVSDPLQPVLQGKMPCIKADGSREVKGVRYFAPVIPAGQVQVLGIAVAPTPEEASGLLEASHGVQMEVKPRLLKGPLGVILSDSMNRFSNLFSDHFAYTTLIPWLLPKSRRTKPKKEEIEWASEALHDLIAETKPRCIVAFGKAVFDQLVDFKIAADDARGGWFSYRDTGIPVYLAEPVVTLITQPWMLDTLVTDFREVDRMMEKKWGNPQPEIPLEYSEIRTMADLEQLVSFWEANDLKLFSVDCEWGGTQYIDGHLRSIQFCWAPGKAAYLNFFDEHGDRHLGCQKVEGVGGDVFVHPNQWPGPEEEYTDYVRVGEILGSWLNQPDVKYMGHHFSADSVWMEHWLGLDVLGKCVFDLEFAAQTCNEYSKLGLEVMAMQHTCFGKYDMALVMWKRDNKLGEDDGYAKIPDSILVPYAMIDTDVVMRCYQPVMEDLQRQELTGYYNNFVLPFVTDVFHTFITAGLPVDPELFRLTRAFFNWAYRALLEDLRDMLEAQADDIVADKTGIPLAVVKRLAAERNAGKVVGAVAALKSMSPDIPEYLVTHWEGIKTFNIRSHPAMRRWLFEVLGLTPVKTTKNADNGMPQMMWDKVLELPEKLRATLSPAVDKETLEILLEQDPTGSIARLLAVSNVGNQCKGFLKEGELDEDGEIVKENGLAKFITSNGKIAPNFSLTETG